MKTISGNFSAVHEWLTLELSRAPVVNVGEWQAQRDVPQELTIEVEDVSFEVPIPANDVGLLQTVVLPNLPWAEEHFHERVGGSPLNPPPSHVRWPFAQAGNSQHRDGETFSHTYPERFWPRSLMPDGIRFSTGDLSDIIQLLAERTGSRQAYLPVWFPEDLRAANQGARVPCTLGYHFLIRNGHLKIVYYIRSCDFFRHFNDDVYMAARLAQWVASQLNDVTPSRLVMHISSLHVFEQERPLLRARANEILSQRMLRVR